jgi:transglutaminase-like putative cysteine protease
MRLTIRHYTRYQYRREVMLQPHRLIVTPRDSGELTTVRRSLDCVPPAEISWNIDVFGNLIATASFAEPSTELMIVSEAIVDHMAPEWPVYPISPDAQSYPFTYALDDVVDLGGLAQPDWLTPGGQDVGAWARAFVLGLQTDSLSLLKDLNIGVLGDIRYRVRDEEGTQSPAETLKLGSGSCRDIAALFIEAARHLGFGARAVSGYLFDPVQTDEDAGSTHAWAEVFMPGAGWIAFDPSHQTMGGSNLIPVAYARLNRQIMPVSGGYIGAADDFERMGVAVRVTAEVP